MANNKFILKLNKTGKASMHIILPKPMLEALNINDTEEKVLLGEVMDDNSIVMKFIDVNDI